MRLLLNSLALLTVGVVAGSNIYWQWANAWIACIVALSAAFTICLTVEKIAARMAYRDLKKEYGADWQ